MSRASSSRDRRSVAVAQVGLVGDALLVEGEHVGHAGPGVEQGDRDVVVGPGGQTGERLARRGRQGREHAALEQRVRPDPVGDGAEPGAVVEPHWREGRQPQAAAAGAGAGRTGARGTGHFPPRIVSLKTPRSGKFGSLSRRAISRRPTAKLARRQRLRVRHPEPLEDRHVDRIDAVDRLRRRVEAAQVDGLAEGEVVGMEDAPTAVRPHPVAEHLEQGLLHLAAEVVGLHADVELDVERDEARRVDLQVVTGHPEALDEVADVLAKRVVDARSAGAVERDEDGVPAPRPAEGRGGALDAGMSLANGRVVRLGHRALLRAERLRRPLPHVLHALGLRAARRGQRVAHRGYGRAR